MLTLISFLLPMLRNGLGREIPEVSDWLVLLGLLAFVLLPLLLTVLPAVLVATTRQKIIASGMALRVERKTLFITRRKTLHSEDLEELEVAIPRRLAVQDQKERVVVARSDDQQLEFGAGLSDEELNWLLRLVQYYVTS